MAKKLTAAAVQIIRARAKEWDNWRKIKREASEIGIAWNLAEERNDDCIALLGHIEALDEQIARLKQVLGEIQWCWDGKEPYSVCPICFANSWNGHYEYCTLANALKEE